VNRFGCLEFESVDKALETLKGNNTIEIEGQKVKLVRQAPDFGKYICAEKQFLFSNILW
jgi:hypothetical protein